MATVMEQLTEAQRVFTDSQNLCNILETIGRTVVDALKKGSTIFSCGNGGSAADALHLAEEFVGRFHQNRRSLPAVCLCADTTALTCIANDFGFEKIFSRPLEALAKPGDILFLFSTSGNSPNILEAIPVARSKQIITVLLSGKTGGKAATLCDHVVCVPSTNTARIQEFHGFILHTILQAVEEAFI